MCLNDPEMSMLSILSILSIEFCGHGVLVCGLFVSTFVSRGAFLSVLQPSTLEGAPSCPLIPFTAVFRWHRDTLLRRL